MMSDHGFHIRRFDAADLPTMQIVRKAAFAPIFQSFKKLIGEKIYAIEMHNADAEQAEYLASICAPQAGHHVYVATVDGHIIGFVTFSLNPEKKIGEIGLNAVHPEHAGQGIGTALYEFVIAEMRQAGMKLATVGTGGDPSHMPAQRAYRKVGFDTHLSNLWMYKILDGERDA